jgi:replicative DNA helicase
LIEDSILANLVFNEEYARKVIAFLKPEYFGDRTHRTVFGLVRDHIMKYNARPSLEALKIELGSLSGLNEDAYYSASEYVAGMKVDADTNFGWLLENSEKFCKGRAIYNALMESVRIVDEEDRSAASISTGVIPKLLQDAIAVSFNTSIGHDYVDDWSERYDFYHLKEDKVPFDLHYFNEITKGGVSKKTLNVIMAPTGVGKSLVMCHMAAANLVSGKNVLYISMEMAEERIAERIDVNLLNLSFDELAVITKDQFKKRVDRIREKTAGKLVVKEYPTATAGVATFRALLDELRIKRNFVPDIIYIDYLNIAASSRIKMSPTVNSYTYVKSIAEEFRGMAIEYEVPIITATQTNRGGADNSDIELTDTSESYGLPMTVDFMVALISDEELEKSGQMIVKQLKNRYSDISRLRRFVVGIDKSRMRLYDTEASAQENLMGGPTDEGHDKYGKDRFDGFM